MATIVYFGVLFLSGVVGECGRKPALLVKAPTKELKALSGSCLQIPCTFKTLQPELAVDKTKPFYAVWLKSDPRVTFKNNIIFNSSGAVRTYPMTIVGKMAEKNCSTMFTSLTAEHTNKYYLRVENGKLKATASCNPIQITVTDTPWNPTLEVSGNQTESEVVTITCSAVTPCPLTPPQLTWDLHQDTASKLEENPDGTFTTKLSRKIPLTTTHDKHQISCSAEYQLKGNVKKTKTTMTLNVTYGPKDTSVRVSPSGSLSAGQSVTLSCSSRANPPVHTFTWFRLSSQGPVSVSQGDTYTFNYNQSIHGQYYCEAKSRMGKQTSTVMHVSSGGVKAAGSSSQAAVIAGAVVGTLLLVAVIFAIWRFKSRSKSAKPAQGRSAAATVTGPHNRGEVQYGQIDLSKFRQEATGHSDNTQEALFSHVNASNMTESPVYVPMKY